MLNQLGIDYTAVIQFGIFIATFFILVKFVYTPFSEIHLERQKKTKGTVEVAEEIQKKSIELHSEYSLKAKEAHKRISEIYKAAKAEAGVELEKIINKARMEAQSMIAANNKNLEEQSEKINIGIKEYSPQVALAISNKLLGK